MDARLVSVALATEMNKGWDSSLHKTAKAPARLGIRVTAGGVVQAIASGPGA